MSKMEWTTESANNLRRRNHFADVSERLNQHKAECQYCQSAIELLKEGRPGPVYLCREGKNILLEIFE